MSRGVAVSLGLLGLGLEVQGTAIRAVAQARGSGAVVEDMPQMAAAIGAIKFSAHHAMAGIGGGLHGSSSKLKITSESMIRS